MSADVDSSADPFRGAPIGLTRPLSGDAGSFFHVLAAGS